MTPRRGSTGEGEDGDLRAYEVDGWRVGYEVEMNGVGVVDASDDDGESDFNDSDDESVVEDGSTEASPYVEYQALPVQVEEPEAGYERDVDSIDHDDHENSNSTSNNSTPSANAFVSPPIRKEFEKLLQECPSTKSAADEVIPHQPTNISLDADKIETIRSAMSNFTLPPPPHMANLDDRQLSEIIREKLQSS